MLVIPVQRDFEDWRSKARKLLAARVAPHDIVWDDTASDEPLLNSITEASEAWEEAIATTRLIERVSVPAEFMTLARTVACHRDPSRWSLLYRVAFRLSHGQEKNLLSISVDDDVHALTMFDRAVSRDRHKMHAFVRFRKVVGSDGVEQFIAWHRPDHYIVKLAAPFFARRFPTMHWAILTPHDSVMWDPTLRALSFGPGATREQAPDEDALEDLWKTYYANIFNPARIKLRAMKKEMPVRHWATLPETQLIPEMLADAPRRVKEMIAMARRNAIGGTERACGELPMTPFDARPFVPASRELPVLREAARSCRGCELHCHATQVVFGEGSPAAQIMMIGEQPGDNEDLEGRPFVGPAGQVLNEALTQVGIDRSRVYVTNAVKHFKFEPRGKRRIHAKPSAREMSACKPWLEAEIQSVRPKLIVCLGATAAQTLMGPAFRINKNRGQPIVDQPWAPWMIATLHPSAILRIPDPVMRDNAKRDFTSDLRLVSNQLTTVLHQTD